MKAKVSVTLAMLMFIVAPAIRGQQALVNDGLSKITVNGEAMVYAKPDKIIFALGIETWNTEIMAAKDENNQILKKTIAVIKELGVREKEIQTDQLFIEPRYKDNYRKEDFIGYFVRNLLVVTLNKMEKREEFITKVLQAGVNHIYGVDFQTTEFKEHREKARELALKAAKEKAKKMAEALDQSVGSPIQISENYTRSSGPYYSSWFGSIQGISRMNTVQNVQSQSAGEISETIALGKIPISSSVTVIFELKK